MADARGLHQIEYRHHQTNDLSPVASSMTSRESLAAWHTRISAWVRHPHADNVSESACYQVFPNGQAALAWRYYDERAASQARWHARAATGFPRPYRAGERAELRSGARLMPERAIGAVAGAAARTGT